MGAIDSICQANGTSLEILSSFMGIHLNLLRHMDRLAATVPVEFSRALQELVEIRESVVEEFRKEIQSNIRKLHKHAAISPAALLIYSSQEDFLESGCLPGLTHITHRYFLEVLKNRLAMDGVPSSLVAFDKALYDAWRGDVHDAPETRAMWAAARYAQLKSAQKNLPE